MIEIAPAFVSAWSSARSAQRKQQNRARDLAGQAEEEMAKLRREYEEKQAYLFRSAVEKTRQTYQNAQAQLAARQALWAAHGLTGESASVREQQADIQQASAQQHAQAQSELQASAAQNEQIYKSAWQKLWDALSSYRRAAHKKSRWGLAADAVRSLLK